MRATWASKEQVYKMLKWTRERRMIDVSKTTRWMSIKVLNYAKYQDIKNDTDDDETTTRRQRDDTETDTIEEEVKKKEIKNNNFVIEKKPPKPKRVWPTRQQKEAIIQEIKRKVEAYWMVYDAQQDKDFAGHILSKKMTEVAQKYGYASPLSFLLSVIDMSMQETGGRLDKRWRYKVNWPKIVYQKYAEICADYQNSMNGKDEGIKKF